MVIGWSVAHGEFTLEDGYYFSCLKRALLERGVEISLLNRLEAGQDLPVLVLNYPEVPFSRKEVDGLCRYVERGGHLIALAYYNNEDRVGEILNRVAEPFGIRFLYDGVFDPVHHLRDDPYLLLTRRVYRYDRGVAQLFFPYSAPVEWVGDAEGEVVVEAEPTACSRFGGRKLALEVELGRGRFTALGTCVFWDNYALPHASNLRFALQLLGVEGA